ncbi:hypothetical protein OS189_01020 [Sulfitobacter sp. F26169L]|uniref:hypothetical protein n=1 Tax=Sulfitobacter sp. F26169L TaxID=2996015 RepID=UPI0022609D45|nr:hypothetical protein [Sulfitobacter sp. F26169L]MCX7564922.1 hypothetical protein [Sulfitobacter sp. F26169L]
MTYQSTIEQFSARMPAAGQVNSTTPFLTARNGFAQLVSVISAIGDRMIKAGEGNARVLRVNALEAKTDAQLAAMGIKRDEIVHHVFKDLYYM